MDSLERLNQVIVRCEKCPRLVAWRREVAKNPPRRYRGERYWAKPIPGFGDTRAKLLIVGLAPAAHGGNRTGRIFTGDRSGDWLYGTLYSIGVSSRRESIGAGDGLKLRGGYVSAAVRCAPPANKPAREEFENCRPYLVKELKLLENLRVVVALGKIAFDTFLKAYAEAGGTVPRPRPEFRHGGIYHLSNRLSLLASYHPSQQNTFTGKLTRRMFLDAFKKARRLMHG